MLFCHKIPYIFMFNALFHIFWMTSSLCQFVAFWLYRLVYHASALESFFYIVQNWKIKCKQIHFLEKEISQGCFQNAVSYSKLQLLLLYLAGFPFKAANPTPSLSFPNCLKPVSRSCLARLQSKFQLDFTFSGGIRGSGGWRWQMH